MLRFRLIPDRGKNLYPTYIAQHVMKNFSPSTLTYDIDGHFTTMAPIMVIILSVSDDFYQHFIGYRIYKENTIRIWRYGYWTDDQMLCYIEISIFLGKNRYNIVLFILFN